MKSSVLDQRGNGIEPVGLGGTHGELEEVVGAEAREVEAADVAVVVLAADLQDVAVAIGTHELVELLADGVHGAARGAGLPSPSLGFSLATRSGTRLRGRRGSVWDSEVGLGRGGRDEMDWVGMYWMPLDG